METLNVEKEKGILRVVFNRPDKLNAINSRMLKELGKVLRDAQKDGEVKVIILTGSGRAFSSGQDVEEALSVDSIGEHLKGSYYPVLLQMRSLEKPIIAAINGIAAGSGLSFALASDISLMKESAELYYAYTAIGLIPDVGALYFTVKRVGYQKAMELSFTSARLSSAEALSLGLVNRVYSDDRFDDAVMEFARKLAEGPVKAYGLTKRLANAMENLTFEEFLDYEAMLQEVAGNTDYFRNAVEKFLGRK